MKAPHAPNRPAFADIPGNPMPRIPYVARDALLHSGLIMSRLSVSALQSICDRILNQPADGAVRFQVFSRYVLFSALYVRRMQSADPVDAPKGFVREADIGFWLPTFGGPVDRLGSWRLRWLPVYLFVDSGPAMANGREIYGYPKILGTIERSAGATNKNASVTVSALAFKTFGPDVEGRAEQIFAWRPHGARDDPQLESMNPEAILQTFNEALFEDRPELAKPLQADLRGPAWVRMPMVFLKQFRDHDRPNTACFQAITEVDVEATSIKGGGWLSPKQELVVTPALASHPLATDLGLADGKPLHLGFWLNLDFSVGFGKTIWAAG